MLAGIGDTSEPWANNTEILTLSSDWQTYTLNLDADGLQGGSGRVMFDMGADTGEVDIDNVSVVVGHIGAETLNHPAINLLSNGAFDSEDGWSGNALNVVDGVSRANIEVAGNPWDVNLSGEVSLIPGASNRRIRGQGYRRSHVLASIGDSVSLTRTIPT